MPRSKGIFRRGVSREFFRTQLYGFKYSYSILIIFKQIYLTNTEDPNKYDNSGSEWIRE